MSKPKTIDLGVLQDNMLAAKHQLDIDLKALERTQSAFDKTRAHHIASVDALKAAMRAALE